MSLVPTETRVEHIFQIGVFALLNVLLVELLNYRRRNFLTIL